MRDDIERLDIVQRGLYKIPVTLKIDFPWNFLIQDLSGCARIRGSREA